MTINLFMYKNLFYNESCVAHWCLVVFQGLDYGEWSWVQDPSFQIDIFFLYSLHSLLIPINYTNPPLTTNLPLTINLSLTITNPPLMINLPLTILILH